ncbi:PI-PLC X domain-containing protein 1 isoform X2 [Mustela putorius furo]|nr:PI-PLC X domain-containing protein 1 isoform X2 [Mustela putorius furo]XP_012919873.1 PI-PLC X domain-containing protein 1 isoform X2 [Mustela putorius furo]XP_012919874.1 PI-PLC X domain-containing protein 1 isoform X2 [Mustela putorius furo]XP_012919875.1 PI-PLC X domain-containing protein 1 isoform X2 [Mustela putorius furo]XP_012919879.1 PI-PLC X domain-containing protein 1 isoform X2 [Mustela putorius furo]
MGGQVSTSGSFRSLPCTTNADWMSALCPVLWDVPLHQLSIPAQQARADPGGVRLRHRIGIRGKASLPVCPSAQRTRWFLTDAPATPHPRALSVSCIWSLEGPKCVRPTKRSQGAHWGPCDPMTRRPESGLLGSAGPLGLWGRWGPWRQLCPEAHAGLASLPCLQKRSVADPTVCVHGHGHAVAGIPPPKAADFSAGKPRHHDLLPEQDVAHLPGPVPAAAGAGQSPALRHPPRGAPVVHHPGAGCHGAAGRGRAVPGPADRTHAGRLGEEPALCAHGVHNGAGGGHAHGDLRVAGEPPPGGGHPGLQGLRGHDGRPARVPGRLHQEHLWGHAVSARGEEGPWGRGWAGIGRVGLSAGSAVRGRGEVCCGLRLRSSGCREEKDLLVPCRVQLARGPCAARAQEGHFLCTSGDADTEPDVVTRPAGHSVLRGGQRCEPARRAVAWDPLLVGRPGETPGAHPLPGAHEELRPPGRAVRGGHQPDGEPGVRPGAPDRVPQEDDAPQPAVPPCVGPGSEPGAGRSVHQHHRGRLHRGGRVRGRRHKTQREAASMLTPSAAPADGGRAAWTRDGLSASP